MSQLIDGHKMKAGTNAFMSCDLTKHTLVIDENLVKCVPICQNVRLCII